MGTSFGFVNAQSSLLQSQQDTTIQQTKSSASFDSDAKIAKGAKDFEAMLLGTWLQQAEQSFATVPGADEDQDVGREQMMSLGVQSLSQSLAASGGIGIAKMVSQAMHSAADKADGGEAPAAPGKIGIR